MSRTLTPGTNSSSEDASKGVEPVDLLDACCILLLLQDAAPCSGELLEAIKGKWASLDNFISTFNTTTAAVQVRDSTAQRITAAALNARACSPKAAHTTARWQAAACCLACRPNSSGESPLTGNCWTDL
jgi:hypothetical protein